MPVSSVLGSFTGLKPGNTILKAHHLSTKRNVGTTRAIAKAKPNNTWNGPINPFPPGTPNNPFPPNNPFTNANFGGS
jgi:hypothetical protein